LLTKIKINNDLINSFQTKNFNNCIEYASLFNMGTNNHEHVEIYLLDIDGLLLIVAFKYYFTKLMVMI